MADVFAVLADPNRRRLVEILREGERPVHELVEALEIEQSGVSRHLRILREAGLVTVRKDAQRRLYSLQPDPLQELDTWIEQYRSLWDDRLDRLSGHLSEHRG